MRYRSSRWLTLPSKAASAAADRDGVEGLEESQTQFAEHLKDFCGGPDGGGGTDEESMLLGARWPA